MSTDGTPTTGNSELVAGIPQISTDVAHLLTAFRDGVREALAEQLVGLYVGGSLLTDDFAPASSDIDFLAITADSLQPREIERLAMLHRTVAAGSPWGSRLEGEYATLADLRPWGIDGDGAAIEPGQALRAAPLTDVTAENLLALREGGLALHGPSPDAVIPPVDRPVFETALRDYLAELLHRSEDDAPATVSDLAGRLLNAARCLYGLRVIRACTKREAAAWLAEEVPDMQPALSIALSVRAGEPTRQAWAILSQGLADLRKSVKSGAFHVTR